MARTLNLMRENQKVPEVRDRLIVLGHRGVARWWVLGNEIPKTLHSFMNFFLLIPYLRNYRQVYDFEIRKIPMVKFS